jgi:hypothetical protein
MVIVKQRSPQPGSVTRRFLRTRVFRVLISVLVVLLIASSTVFILYYNRYAQVIDIKLSRVFPNTAKFMRCPQSW